MSVSDTKDKATRLKETRADVTKKWGKGALVPTDGVVEPLDFFPTGSFQLDLALGIGGFPRGRLIELFGYESTGKSTLSLACAAEAQKRGETVLYLDHENAFDPSYAKVLGVNIDDPLLWILAQPDSLEEGFDILYRFVKAGIGLAIVDSLAGMVPKKEVEGGIGENFGALQARLVSEALRKMIGPIHASKVAVIFVNHLKQTIGGGMSAKTTPGGRALKFYSSIRVELTRIESTRGMQPDLITGKKVDTMTGMRIRARVLKNKTAAPMKAGEFFLRSEMGICEELAVLEAGEKRGLVVKSGSRYILPFKVKDKPVNCNGQQAAIAYLVDNPKHYESLRNGLLKVLQSGAPVVESKKAAATKTSKLVSFDPEENDEDPPEIFDTSSDDDE